MLLAKLEEQWRRLPDAAQLQDVGSNRQRRIISEKALDSTSPDSMQCLDFSRFRYLTIVIVSKFVIYFCQRILPF